VKKRLLGGTACFQAVHTDLLEHRLDHSARVGHMAQSELAMDLMVQADLMDQPGRLVPQADLQAV